MIIRRGEERAVGQRQILCRVVVVIRIIRAGRTRKTAVLIQKISQSFSPRKRDEREREREKEKREESAPSNYTLSSQESASFSCHRAYNNRQKKELLLLLLLLTWLGQFTTRKDIIAPREGGKPKVVIFFLVGKGGGAFRCVSK